MTAPAFAARRPTFRHPAQYIVVTFAVAILTGTLLLMLPISAHGERATFTEALFTATSATCVTGLSVVDTATFWSGFGHVVILGLIQVGGLGIMTLTSLLVILISRRLGVRQRLIAASSTNSLSIGDVRQLILGIMKLTAAVELSIAFILFLRFWLTHGEPFGHALWLGLFHSVSAFNNAGFALFSRNLIDYQTDPLILTMISAGIVIGGLGYPVWRQIKHAPRSFRKWDLHAKITVTATAVLLLGGWLLFLIFEWSNPNTFGPLGVGDTIANGLMASATTRTAGFESIATGQLHDTSQLLAIVLMFIGAGSGSTGGGIKVTTFALLGWVIWAEVRGEKEVTVFRRRVPADVQRRALTVAFTAIAVLTFATFLLLAFSPFDLSDVVFEAVSALGTVGLTTGITMGLPIPARLIVTALMYLGRVGPPTLFAALVLRDRGRLYRYPEERIIIG